MDITKEMAKALIREGQCSRAKEGLERSYVLYSVISGICPFCDLAVLLINKEDNV